MCPKGTNFLRHQQNGSGTDVDLSRGYAIWSRLQTGLKIDVDMFRRVLPSNYFNKPAQKLLFIC